MDPDSLNLPETEFDDVRLCDSCTQELDHGEHIVVYFCDVIWVHSIRQDLPQVIAQEIYCLDCYPNEIPIPHLGTNEGLTLSTMEFNPGNESYSYKNQKVIKGSSRTSGIDWNPNEILEKYHTIPLQVLDYNITPMYTYMLFRKTGVDLRGFVEDETLVIPEDVEGSLMETVKLGIQRTHEISYRPEML